MRTTAGRRLVLGALVLATGCAGPVALDTRPTDVGQAEALIGAVGDEAGCGSAELLTAAADHWDFTCQRDGDEFLVQAAARTQIRDALAARLRSTGTPVRTGPFYVVSPVPACPVKDVRSCVTPPATSLERFPGR